MTDVLDPAIARALARLRDPESPLLARGAAIAVDAALDRPLRDLVAPDRIVKLAADAIVEGLQGSDTSAAQLGKWGVQFNQGVDRMRRLVCEYYDGFSFGAFVRNYPHLRGTVTDLLIGDLFENKVDKVWQPMESLYPPGKAPIPPWSSGTPTEQAAHKANELFLPDGRRP